jgi:hypothetical protein
MSGQAQVDYDALADQARKLAASASPVATSKKKAQPTIDYDALAAQSRQAQETSPAAPDLTTNSIDPSTGTGYGLYRMGSYDYNQGQVTKPEILVPYNRVADAQAAGYSLHPDDAPRYQNDTAHNGSVSRAIGQVKSLLSRMTEPMPDRPLNGTPFQNAAAALTNVGQIPFNVVNRTVRGVAGLPQGVTQTAVDASQGNPEGLDPFAMGENSYKNLQQDTADLGPVAALSNLGGDAATMYATGKLGSHAIEVGTEPMMKVVRSVRNAPEFVARVATGTGKGPVEELVTQRQLANEGIDKANVSDQRAYNRKIGETARNNRETTVAERAKADQAGKLQVGGSQLIYGLRQLDKALRTKANDLYGAVREKMAGVSLPSDTLADGVKAAQKKWIRGSPAKVAEFNAMMSPGQPGPELVLADQTAQNMGYKDFRTAITNPAIRSTLSRALPPDVWQAAIGQGTRPILWNDLQGFYEETGAKVAEGPQPGKGDIYKALQQVHQFVGDQMQQLADAQGVGPQHRAARAFYSGYMDTFHEPTGPSGSGSPVAQALLAKDPLVAVDKFAGDSGDRGVAVLRRYSDSLANLAQDVRQRAQTKVTVPARKSMTSASPFELKPHQTISAGDITAAYKAAAEASAGKWWSRGRWAAAAPVIWAMRGFFGGHIPPLLTTGLESGGILAASHAAASLLRYPPMIEFLTKARPEDTAMIPPELRGDLPGLVSQAQHSGIKVSPALIAATASAAITGTPRATDLPSQLPPQVQQAIQAMLSAGAQ